MWNTEIRIPLQRLHLGCEELPASVLSNKGQWVSKYWLLRTKDTWFIISSDVIKETNTAMNSNDTR